MAPGGETDVSVSDGASNFQAGLEALKRRGSALLVVGSVPTEMYSRASAQMLGAPDEPRRRLLVVNKTTAVEQRLESSIKRSAEWTRTIRYSAHARSSVAASSFSSPLPTATERHVDGGLGKLGAEISGDIEDFATLSQCLSPAELRVAFDCLPSLLSEYELNQVFRFLHVVTSHVRAHHGMIHVWSPGDRTSEVNRMLEPLFDAVVELSVEGSEPRQRWHLKDANVSSGWFPLNR
ncbi:hypothetical protein ACFQJC_10890 [Haloferax namakaokahaiae]|uniref:Uncharacterized protein n=1 Tax=Haloferax namakaokahaiae TaxID=1748331 RepID=A0ABD5ZGN5_9EURY